MTCEKHQRTSNKHLKTLFDPWMDHVNFFCSLNLLKCFLWYSSINNRFEKKKVFNDDTNSKNFSFLNLCTMRWRIFAYIYFVSAQLLRKIINMYEKIKWCICLGWESLQYQFLCDLFHLFSYHWIVKNVRGAQHLWKHLQIILSKIMEVG